MPESEVTFVVEQSVHYKSGFLDFFEREQDEGAENAGVEQG